MKQGSGYGAMKERWTFPINKSGSVIYFGVRGRPFFFNGHKGIFYDSLPDSALEVLEAFRQSGSEQNRGIEEVRRKLDKRCRDALREIQLYRSGQHPSLAPEKKQTKFCQRLRPNIFDVYVSQTCNLACRYCVNQQGTFGGARSQMSVATAHDLVQFLTSIVRAEEFPVLTVILFGGEPLLSRPALNVLVRGLQELNRAKLRTRVHTVLSTNGTIYDEEVFGILAEQPDCNTITVSLDAFKSVHDANRPFADPAKGSTYDVVTENLRKMIEAGIPYSVTCVVPYPYDYVAASEELHRLGIERLEIKPLIRHIFGQKKLPEVFREEFALWREKYLDYTDYYLNYLSSGGRIVHNDRRGIFGAYSQALADTPRRTLGCGIADMKMSVTADGCLLPCECLLGKDFAVGDVRTGIGEAKYDEFERWILAHGQFRVEHERCRKCYAKRSCGGGCYALTYDLFGYLEPLPEAACEYCREQLKIDLYFISRMRKEHPDFVPGGNGDCS